MLLSILLPLAIVLFITVFAASALAGPVPFRSKPEHYRMRAEFRIWHEQERSFYRMFDSETKRPFSVESFPAGAEKINEIIMLS